MLYNYNINLHSNANLISFMALPEDNSLDNVLESLEGSINSIIGQGVAASPNPTLGWVGSLNSISYGDGYWIIMNEPATVSITSPDYPGSVSPNYMLNIGANLISFPSDGSADVSSALPDDVEECITGIITEGGATTQISNNTWVGSLSSFEGGEGYWLISACDICFSFDLSTLSRINIVNKHNN